MSNLLAWFLRPKKAAPRPAVVAARPLREAVAAPAATGFQTFASRNVSMVDELKKVAPDASSSWLAKKDAPTASIGFAAYAQPGNDAYNALKRYHPSAGIQLFKDEKMNAWKGADVELEKARAEMSINLGLKFKAPVLGNHKDVPQADKFGRPTKPLKREVGVDAVDKVKANVSKTPVVVEDPPVAVKKVDKVDKGKGPERSLSPKVNLEEALDRADAVEPATSAATEVRRIKALGSALNAKGRAVSPSTSSTVSGFAGYGGRRRRFDEVDAEVESGAPSTSLAALKAPKKRSKRIEAANAAKSSASSASTSSFASTSTADSSSKHAPVASTSKTTVEDLKKKNKVVVAERTRSKTKRTADELEDVTPSKKRKSKGKDVKKETLEVVVAGPSHVKSLKRASTELDDKTTVKKRKTAASPSPVDDAPASSSTSSRKAKSSPTIGDFYRRNVASLVDPVGTNSWLHPAAPGRVHPAVAMWTEEAPLGDDSHRFEELD
ncbi:hypothetical protein JCM8208_001991 [Rhodotorula glutinis]